MKMLMMHYTVAHYTVVQKIEEKVKLMQTVTPQFEF